VEESEEDELPDGPLHYLFGSQGRLYLAPLAPRVRVFTAYMEKKKTYLMRDMEGVSALGTAGT
jgi:hypothetical protein